MSAQIIDAETSEIIASGERSADLVPVANMDALDQLDPVARDLAVTRMLDQAAAWLAHAKEATLPAQDIADFRAFVATAAEASKRVRVSKDIQLDAIEMVRRSERELGLAIRRGQESGEIKRRGDAGGLPTPGVRGSASRTSRDDVLDERPSSKDYVAHSQERADLYDMTDDVTDEAFDEAIAEAKAEENLSRANVVRKVKAKATPVGEQVERIRELASQGWHSTQIAKELGLKSDRVRRIAKAYDITLTADDVLRGAQHHIDMTRLARETVSSIESAASSLSLLDYAQIDVAEAVEQEWATTLTDSLRALNRFSKQIKEMTHVHE